MLVIISKVLVIFAIILVGVIAGKAGIVPKSADKPLIDILMLITTPCLIISSLAEAEFNTETEDDTIAVIIMSVMYFVVFTLLSFPLAKLLKKTPKEDLPVLMGCMVGINTGFMGFPVTKSIFGDYIFYLMVIENIMLNFYLYGILVLQLNYGREKKGEGHSLLKSIFSLCTIASIAGVVIMITGFKLPTPVSEFFSIVGDATVPLSMLIVGLQMAQSSIKKIIKNRDLVITSLINIVLIPVLTFLMVNWLPFSAEAKATALFASCFPCAVGVVGVAARENKNYTLASECVALTTAASMITLPLAAMFISAFYGV
ncbi:MAG: AEC family transporter [Eubacterium sp.]|jgi:predicted permease